MNNYRETFRSENRNVVINTDAAKLTSSWSLTTDNQIGLNENDYV